MEGSRGVELNKREESLSVGNMNTQLSLKRHFSSERDVAVSFLTAWEHRPVKLMISVDIWCGDISCVALNYAFILVWMYIFLFHPPTFFSTISLALPYRACSGSLGCATYFFMNAAPFPSPSSRDHRDRFIDEFACGGHGKRGTGSGARDGT